MPKRANDDIRRIVEEFPTAAETVSTRSITINLEAGYEPSSAETREIYAKHGNDFFPK